jgi:hypothetical protein
MWMNQIDLALRIAESRIQLAIPNPKLWSGFAAQACAESLERLAAELHGLQHRLASWQW